MKRPAIPKELQHKVLHDSAYKCVVCQASGCQIHHIDQNRTNNVESNLVALCANHHGEAHTRRDHQKNLDVAALHHAKRRWNDAVRKHRERLATVEGQKSQLGESSILATGIAWGYINHTRVGQIADVDSLNGKYRDAFQYCRYKRIVDSSGIPIKPANWSAKDGIGKNTVYDWFEFGDDQRFHLLYTGLVDQLALHGNVVHCDSQTWSIETVESLVQSGSLVLLTAYFSFKKQRETPENEHRRVMFTKKGAILEFFIDTRNMFGDTSIYNSFTGRKTASALVLVKDVSRDSKTNVIVSASPIALGVGFQFSAPQSLEPEEQEVAT